MGELIEANNSNFKEIIESTKGIILVDFSATWCGPCKTLGPILQDVADEVEDVTIIKVNVDDNTELSMEYGVRSIPVVFAIRDGEQLDKFVGAKSKDDVISFIKGLPEAETKIEDESKD